MVQAVADDLVGTRTLRTKEGSGRETVAGLDELHGGSPIIPSFFSAASAKSRNA